MSSLALHPPSVRVELVRPAPEPSPLRSDVAGFIGPTRRGPIGIPVRVDGLRDYHRVFGDLDPDHDTTYAVRGYFENGGTDAWVLRLAPPETPTAYATWRSAGLAGMPDAVTFHASSPGDWAEELTLELVFRREGVRGRPELDLFARDGEGATEALVGVDAWTLARELEARSSWLRCDELPPAPLAAGAPSPRTTTETLRFQIAQVALPAVVKEDYLAAIDRLGDQPEVALVVMPELHALPGGAVEVLQHAIAQAEQLRDRLVLVDLPRDVDAASSTSVADAVKQWLIGTLGRTRLDVPWRAAACYFPWIRVDDPLDRARALRSIAPSGHVAGNISLLDRERGAHHTPAVEPMIGVFDLELDVSRDDHAVLNEEGVNVLRCVPGRGFAIWGGRTLDRARDQRYVAHRRLIHRLVRAIRRVAEPLVFETNGPELWLQLVRGVTAVLLEAWRTGALQGARADEAFRVQCDAETNPPEEIELGRCLCRVSVAPATPMEFIVLRLALGRDGSLEVLP